MSLPSKKKFLQDYAKEVEIRLVFAEIALHIERNNTCIRELQCVLELLLKMLLIRWGFVVPRKHELSNELNEIKELYSSKLTQHFPAIQTLSKFLRKERDSSLYGDFNEEKSQSQLYLKKEVKHYFSELIFFKNLIFKELKEFL